MNLGSEEVTREFASIDVTVAFDDANSIGDLKTNCPVQLREKLRVLAQGLALATFR